MDDRYDRFKFGRFTWESTLKISHTLFWVLNAEISRPRFIRLLVKA